MDGRPLLYEDVTLKAADGVRLHAWLIRSPRAPASRGPTVIFFQENAGNIAHRLPNVGELLRHVGPAGAGAVLLLSYRGYGHSEGAPSEAGIRRDAQAALDYVRARPDLDPLRVVLFGRSLGGAVAVALAAANPGAVSGLGGGAGRPGAATPAHLVAATSALRRHTKQIPFDRQNVAGHRFAR